MFMVTIMADVKVANGDVRRVAVGDEYGCYIARNPSYAFERLVETTSPRPVPTPGAIGVEHNFEVIVYRAEEIPWGEDELKSFGIGSFANIIEGLANDGTFHENWEEPPITEDERRALGDALNAALAAWSKEHGISSGVWRETGEPLLTLPAFVDEVDGVIAISDEDHAKLEALT